MRIESTPASLYLAIAAKAILASRDAQIPAHALAKITGAPEAVVRILQKSVIVGGTTDTDFGEVLAETAAASGAFAASMRSQSIFFRISNDGTFLKSALRSRIGIIGAGVYAYVVGESRPTPISRLTLTGVELLPKKVAALIVVTRELARSMDDRATGIVNSEMRAGLADAVDAEFFAQIIDDSTVTFSSAGSNRDDYLRDLRVLLNAVNTTGGGKLYWAMAPDVANAAAIFDDAGGAMTPQGGELLGLPALVSSVMTAGTLRLINAAAIAANTGAIELGSSSQATLDLITDTPDSPAPDAPAMSLFQSNASALKVEIEFAVKRLRANAVAEMTGIEWGAGADSP